LAQELKEILPEAVMSLENKTYNGSNREPIDQLLVIDKNRIFMENVGATQEIDKLVTDLDKRVTNLETVIAILPSVASFNDRIRHEQKHQKKKRNSKNSDEADYDTTYTSDSSSLDIENVTAVPVQERQQISETGGVVVIMNTANSSKGDKRRHNKIDANENSSSMIKEEKKCCIASTPSIGSIMKFPL